MIIRRNLVIPAHGGQPVGTADECHEAMLRHGKKNATRTGPAVSPVVAAGVPHKTEPADIIYGARAIAAFIFADDPDNQTDRARRRVFNLWTHYRDRNERSGLFKLKGALCLSKRQWRNFHGLD